MSTRTRRTNLSNKVPNVKLRPAPILSKSSSKNFKTENRHGEEDEGMGLMDKEVVRRLNEADHLADESSGDVELEHTRPARPFEGLTICFTAVPSDAKVNLTKKLSSMGVLKVEGNLTMDTSALISQSFDSVKYQAAVNNRIPVYTPEWIEAIHLAWISGEDVPNIFSKMFHEYYLPPFADLKISISGIEPLSKRSDMMGKIADMGGIYSKTLDPSCTHLVIAQPELKDSESVDLDAIRTSKVDWALRRNAKAEQVRRRRRVQRDPREEEPSDERMIMIVWEGWFWDCADFNGRFPEDRWRLENQPIPPPHSFCARETERIDKETDERNRQEQEHLERLMQDVVDHDAKPVREVKVEPLNGSGTGKVEMHRLGNVPDNELEPAKLRKRPLPSGSTDNTKTDSRTRLVHELMSSIGVKTEPETSVKPSSNSPDQPDAQHNALLGSHLTKTEEYASPSGDRARKRARLAPVDPAHPSVTNTGMAPRPQATERVSVVHTSRASAFNESNNADNKPAPFTQNRSSKSTGSLLPASMAKRQAVPDMVKAMALNPVLFKDLIFSHDVEAGYQAMEAAIIGSGGKLISQDDVRNGANVHYLISRMECVPTLIPRLKSSTQRVTESWVEMCLTEDRLISPEEHVAYRPLATPMPVPDLKGKAIHLSGYQETSELWILRRLVRAFGAEVPLQLSKRGTTHLVCKESGGTKHLKAIQWGIPVLRQDWLFHVAKTGDASVEAFILPFSQKPDDDVRPDVRPASEKRALGGNLTANMSMLNEQGSFFGMSEASAGKSDHDSAPTRDDHATCKPSKPPSQVSASRQLGLTATVLDLQQSIVERPASNDQNQTTAADGSVPDKKSQHSKSLPPLAPVDVWVHAANTEHLALRTDIGPSERLDATNNLRMGNAKATSTGKLGSTVSTPVNMIENMIKRLEPEKTSSERDLGIPIRRRRAQPRPLSTSTKSGSASPANAIADVMFKNYAGPTDTQQANETAEESARVQYMDPAAERERQRLLAGFRDKGAER